MSGSCCWLVGWLVWVVSSNSKQKQITKGHGTCSIPCICVCIRFPTPTRIMLHLPHLDSSSLSFISVVVSGRRVPSSRTARIRSRNGDEDYINRMCGVGLPAECCVPFQSRRPEKGPFHTGCYKTMGTPSESSSVRHSTPRAIQYRHRENVPLSEK